MPTFSVLILESLIQRGELSCSGVIREGGQNDPNSETDLG